MWPPWVKPIFNLTSHSWRKLWSIDAQSIGSASAVFVTSSATQRQTNVWRSKHARYRYRYRYRYRQSCLCVCVSWRSYSSTHFSIWEWMASFRIRQLYSQVKTFRYQLNRRLVWFPVGGEIILDPTVFRTRFFAHPVPTPVNTLTSLPRLQK